jgi:integrase
MGTPKVQSNFKAVKGCRGVYVRTDENKESGTFFIKYYDPEGKRVFEKAEIPRVRMTARKAVDLRSDRMRGIKPSNRERREAEAKVKAEEEGRWTFDRLMAKWFDANPTKKGKANDVSRYRTHLKEPFGDREPRDLVPLDVERLKSRLLRSPTPPPGRRWREDAKRRRDESAERIAAARERQLTRPAKVYSPGTVKSILSLLVRLANFGVKCQLCDGLRFKVEGPRGVKERTEDMSEEQMARYIKVCREWPDPQAGNFQLVELFTGMRRGSARNLKWADVDLDRGFLHLRDTKTGDDKTVPLPEVVRELLTTHPEVGKNPYVFAGKKGGPRGARQVDESGRAIRAAAGLPDTFRPNHGLRHTFASHLASSGEVDLFTLGKLLGHRSTGMTARYAHLRDDTLRRGANVMGRFVARVERASGE